MARRRMIDPNIWASEDMSKLTLRQRLLVIGLFSNADDYGKGKAKATYLRSIVFPYDDIPVNEIVDDIETIRAVISIHFYEVEGNSYYKFINWEKWQTVQKPQNSLIPEQVENDSLLSQESFSPKGKEEKGKEDEDKGKEDTLTTNSNPHENRIHEMLKLCKINGLNMYSLEQIFSYIGMADIETIITAIKKSEDKHINYVMKIIKEDMNKPKGGQDFAKPRGSAERGDNIYDQLSL